MKKILILAMSCNQDFFIKQEKAIKDTWAKDIINNKYQNIDFLIYKGDSEKNVLDKNENTLYLRCEDDINNTFKKTYYALSLISKNFDYDYIFRTNTSTYINVKLLNEFIQSLEDDSILWTSDMYSLSESLCPYPLYLYGRGNGLLFSKKLVNIILKEGINFIYLRQHDDWTIGNILNSYWMKNDENYLDHIKNLTHGWYKSIKVESDNRNSLCKYYNTNKDFDFIKKFVTIQIKRYYSRENENESFYELNEVFENNTDNLNDTVKEIYEYSQNPNIFIGSTLGYLSYNDWLNMDKNELYSLEINHK